MGVKRFGVAFVATASIVLAYGLPARAQEAPPPPPSSPAETTSPEAGTPTPDAPQPTPSSSEPTKSDTPTPDATPSADTAKTETSSTESTPAPDAKSPEPETTEPAKTEPAKTEPAKTEPTEAKPAEATAAKDVVKLEPAAPSAAPSSPSAAAPAPQPATPATAPSAGPPPVMIELEVPAAAPAGTTGSADEAAEAATALIVSFRPRRAPSAISLLPVAEPTVISARPAPRRAISAKTAILQTCARPTARVPLSPDCEQARAISALRVRLTYLPSSEVRAAIIRGPTRNSIRRAEGRSQPESKAVKKHPVAKVRPTVPFGSSGQGAANHSFNRSTGATSSARILVLAAPALRVPRPSRFVRLRLRSTTPHGVIAAPPPARPG